MNLNQVNADIKKVSPKKRLGRGTGSGHGKTSGRGHKGQGSRAGFSMPHLFEGGQMPLVRRVPKRGFNNTAFAEKVGIVNVCDLEALFENDDEINPSVLVEKGLLKQAFDSVKILGNGELTKKLNVGAHLFSASAKQKIEAAGGTVNILPGKKPVVKNKMGARKAALVEKFEAAGKTSKKGKKS